MKRISKTVCLSLLSALLLTGCGFNGDNNAVIIINGNPITKQQYETKLKEANNNPMFKQLGIDIKKEPDGFVGLMLKDRIVNELMVQNIIDAEIEKRKIKVTDKDVEGALKDIIDKVGSKERFNEILKQSGISSSQFKKDLTEELKIKKLVDSLAIINVTEEMTRKYYNTNLDKFKYPDKVRASHILISADAEKIREMIKAGEDASKLSAEEIEERVNKELNEKKAKAEKILAEVKSDPSKFAAIAKDNSDDPGSAQSGGDLGYFSADQMVEPFSKAAFSMKPSTISNLVKSQYGYHIILVKDRVAAGTEPYDKVKEDIKAFLENQEKIKVLQNFVNTTKQEANIEYVDPSFNPDELQKKIKAQAKDNPMFKPEPKK